MCSGEDEWEEDFEDEAGSDEFDEPDALGDVAEVARKGSLSPRGRGRCSTRTRRLSGGSPGVLRRRGGRAVRVEGALSVIAEERTREAGLLGQAEAQAYTRGRISAYLGQINATIDSGAVQRLESDIAVYQQLVPDLEEQLDAEAIEEKLTHSLGYLSGKMTAHARALKLEHGDGLVRLNPKKGERAMTTELVVSELVTNAIRYAEPPIRLTVVTDTPAGITELLRIGSTKNHAGYHLAAHLALHQYFAANSRPVPRFLMLDQPTQPYYPSDLAKRCGRLEDLGSFVWISRSLVRVCR